MTDSSPRAVSLSNTLFIYVAGLSITLLILFGLVAPARSVAQTSAPAKPQGIAGTWQGTLHPGRDLRTVVKISKGDDGGYNATFYSIDQGGDGLPVKKITLDGGTVTMSLPSINGSYEGKLSADGNAINGSFTQGQTFPLNLVRATPETEWTIPPPAPKLPPMDANANPSFEVATIKPSKPDEQRRMFVVQGRRFKIVNQPLTQILCFAYDVQDKQLIGLPPWAATDKFDIDAEPDGEGAPSSKQWKSMLQKMAVERFQLKFHQDKKELPVYVLSVAKGGPRLAKSEGDPNGLPGLFFRGRLGDLGVRNANMNDFTGLMQSVVLDRPVLDQTELKGRFDFTLVWTPDDSQFGGMKLPPPPDAASPAPNLYTAMQEQIGLKLEATKAPADVMVFDHVEKPSDN